MVPTCRLIRYTWLSAPSWLLKPQIVVSRHNKPRDPEWKGKILKATWRVGKGGENETNYEMSRKVNQSRVGGMGGGGRQYGKASTSPREKQQLWTCLMRHGSDFKATDVTVVFTRKAVSFGGVCRDPLAAAFRGKDVFFPHDFSGNVKSTG